MSDHKLDEDIKISKQDNAAAEAEFADKADVRLVAGTDVESSGECASVADQALDKESGGKSFGNYEIYEELGEGTLGKVFRAKNVASDSEFTLKIISADFCRSKINSEAIRKSLKKAGSISNPHLATYYDSGELDGDIYAVSDLVKGMSLDYLISSGSSLDAEQFVDIFRQVCQALKSIHAEKMVHADLKPSNIFVVQTDAGHEFVKVVDFGIAGVFGDEQRHEYLRKSGARYLSPEQCLGYDIDARSDIYTLGLIMYEAITGQPFVEGQTAVHSMLKNLNMNPRRRLKHPAIPDWLKPIIGKCLEKNRSQRYSSVEDLEMDLELGAAALTDVDVLSMSKSSSASSRKMSHEDRIKFVLSSFICAGVLGCIVIASVNVLRTSERMPPLPPMPSQSIAVPNQSQNFGAGDAKPTAPTLIIPAASSIRAAEALINSAVTPMSASGEPESSSLAQQNYSDAEAYYLAAIEQYREENKAKSGTQAYKYRLAQLQTDLAEVYMRGNFSPAGGRYSRNYFATGVGNMFIDPSTENPVLEPTYPGLVALDFLQPDYKSAEGLLESAVATLDNKFTGKHLDLLWDIAFTKYNLGKINEAIETHQKLIDVLQKEPVQDNKALIANYDNLGRLFLALGQPGKAVHEFKTARGLDRQTHRVYGTGELTDAVRADLAYGFYLEGKLRDAEKVARKNLRIYDSLDEHARDLAGNSINLNYFVLDKILRSQGKIAEADAIEHKAHQLHSALF